MNKLEMISNILCLRFHKKLTYAEIAMRRGISRQAVCQYVNTYIDRIRNKEIILPKRCPFCNSFSIIPTMLQGRKATTWRKYSTDEEKAILVAKSQDTFITLANASGRSKEAICRKHRRLKNKRY